MAGLHREAAVPSGHPSEASVDVVSPPTNWRLPPLHVRTEEVEADQGADLMRADAGYGGDLGGAGPLVAGDGLQDPLDLPQRFCTFMGWDHVCGLDLLQPEGEHAPADVLNEAAPLQ